jgi:hypothetical protein
MCQYYVQRHFKYKIGAHPSIYSAMRMTILACTDKSMRCTLSSYTNLSRVKGKLPSPCKILSFPHPPQPASAEITTVHARILTSSSYAFIGPIGRAYRLINFFPQYNTLQSYTLPLGYIGWRNRFLGSVKVLKYHLRAQNFGIKYMPELSIKKETKRTVQCRQD